MPITAILDRIHYKNGILRLLWNRSTRFFIRGAKVTTEAIAQRGLSSKIRVIVQSDGLYFEQVIPTAKISRSHNYAKRLFHSGITEIEVERNTPGEIKLVLDILAGSSLSVLLDREEVSERIVPGHITLNWLKENKAAIDLVRGDYFVDWFKNQKETDSIKVVEKLIANDEGNWAGWLIMKLMDYPQYVSHAVYTASLVLDIYERKYSGDERPRKAIEASQKCITDPSIKNKNTARKAKDMALKAALEVQRGTHDRGAFSAASAASHAAACAADAIVHEAARAGNSAVQAVQESVEERLEAGRHIPFCDAQGTYMAKQTVGKALGEAWRRILEYGIKLLREGARDKKA